MAITFGTLSAELPVRLQIGDGELVELGTVTLTSSDTTGKTIVDKSPVAALLRDVAATISDTTEDDRAAAG